MNLNRSNYSSLAALFSCEIGMGEITTVLGVGMT